MTDVLAIGVDIGGTRTKSGLVNLSSGEVLQQVLQPTATSDEQLFMQQLEDVTSRFKALAKTKNAALAGIGIGVPGFTLSDGSVQTTYGFLQFMEQYPLTSLVEARCSLPCVIDNDARTVSLGEAKYGKGKRFNRVLTLTLGTGVGFGMVVNERFTEPLPLAHMGGHITVTANDQRCYCGKTGCLEDLVCSAGILRMATVAYGDGQGISVPGIFAAAAAGNDTHANNIINRVVEYLHTAIHNYANLFAPDIIVLGGGIAKGLAPYLEKIKGKSYLSAYPDYSFELVISNLEEKAGMLGSAALLLAREHKQIT